MSAASSTVGNFLMHKVDRKEAGLESCEGNTSAVLNDTFVHALPEDKTTASWHHQIDAGEKSTNNNITKVCEGTVLDLESMERARSLPSQLSLGGFPCLPNPP